MSMNQGTSEYESGSVSADERKQEGMSVGYKEGRKVSTKESEKVNDVSGEPYSLINQRQPVLFVHGI